MTIDDVVNIAMQVDWFLKAQRSPALIARKISIGVTPETYREIDKAAQLDVQVFRDPGTASTLRGYPVKIIEQPNGERARGAWMMVELDTEA